MDDLSHSWPDVQTERRDTLWRDRELAAVLRDLRAVLRELHSELEDAHMVTALLHGKTISLDQARAAFARGDKVSDGIATSFEERIIVLCRGWEKIEKD